MNSYSRDMTTGNEYHHIIKFVIPLLVGNLLQQLYNIADTIIVGQYLGKNAIAAIGATGSITYLFYTLCLGLATGAGILVAQFYGAGKYQQMKEVIVNSFYVVVGFGVLISLVATCLAREVLIFLGTPQALLSDAAGYMMITCGGTLAVAVYNWINAVLRALGNSRTPLIYLGVASVLNVVLDYFFVFGLHTGVVGAAWATVLAQAIAGILSIWSARKNSPHFQVEKELLKWKTDVMKKCIVTGIPIAAQNGFVSISMVVLQHVTNTFGETVMAAYTVSMRIEQFIQQPFASLNIAVSTFVGQNTGAGKDERARKGYYVGMKIGMLFAVFVMGVFCVLAPNIMRCFVSEGAVIQMGAKALRITAVFYTFLGTIHITRGFLNGIGDTNYALFNGLVEVICRVVFSIILTRISGIGYWGIWWTTSITWVATAAVSVIRYRQKAFLYGNTNG